MDSSVLKDFYRDRGFSEEEADRAEKVFSEYQSWIEKRNRNVETSGAADMRDYLELLTKEGKNEPGDLLTLARIMNLGGNRGIYIYFTQILERDNIIDNLRSHIGQTLGPEKTAQLYKDLCRPEPGAPPDEAVQYTSALLSRMEQTLTGEECRIALTANAHAIPAEAFTGEAEYFRRAPDLETYLKESHNRSVKTLQQHADNGTVWFEQIITQPVVDFVRKNNEILGGSLEGDTIYWTKIPYDTVAWMQAKTAEEKGYFACHCPMAREVFRQPGKKIQRIWCHCTSGFIKQRFSAIFGEEVHVDLLESVLGGDKHCRFAVRVPKKFL